MHFALDLPGRPVTSSGGLGADSSLAGTRAAASMGLCQSSPSVPKGSDVPGIALRAIKHNFAMRSVH